MFELAVQRVVVNWLPALDHTRTFWPRLTDEQVVFFHRKGRALMLRTEKSPSKEPEPGRRKAWRQNPLIVALELKAMLESTPHQTHLALAKQLKISRGRVCQYLRLVRLPPEIISFMVDPKNMSQAELVSEDDLRSILKIPGKDAALSAFHELILSNKPKRL